MNGDEILQAELSKALAECKRLGEENAELRNRLDNPQVAPLRDPKQATNACIGNQQRDENINAGSSPEAKVALFRTLFRGRDDVYPVRWERNGKSGYSPAGVREWDRSTAAANGKKKSFHYTKLFPLTDEVITDHLLGKHTIGIYPVLQDDTCWFVAIDFDKKSWQADALAFLKSCRQAGVPASLERSRSGDGGHVWIFFATPIQSALARKLATALLTFTMEHRYAMGLDSYDRLFPSQDTLPKGGFGNLIALPLQHDPREKSNSVFVDDQFRPFRDQWAFLSSVKRLTADDVQAIVRKMFPSGDVLDIKYSASDYDEENDPWITPRSAPLLAKDIRGTLPEQFTINLSNLIYIEKKDLPEAFLDQLVRLAAFQNPEFYKTQAMRLSTFGKPRVIACAEDLRRYVGLPRGVLEGVMDLFRRQRVRVDIVDYRFVGNLLQVDFQGERRPNQTQAAKALAAHDAGVLCAPTAFGKTAVAAQLIAMRKVNTLILVHRRHLMDQWRERLALFLGLTNKQIGQIGGGRSSRNGNIDVAVIQSLVRRGEVKDLVSEYGQVIVDECHHVSAFSFEQVLKKVKAKYVVGLTATPIRKDGHHPIIMMQCGPIRFNINSRQQTINSAIQHELIPRITTFSIPPECQDIAIHETYSALVNDEKRNELIVTDVVTAIEEGRFPLLLTERTDHIQLLLKKLERLVPNLFVMKGGMGKKQRDLVASQVRTLPKSQPRVIIATGRYIGEGFDDALLDTLFLAMPISWRGTLQQYVGRLHRLHENKHLVQVYDYVDASVPVLNRMYEKRLKAYKAVGYCLASQSAETDRQADLRFATIERVAVEAAIAFEEARGCKVESVESDACGFDLISRCTNLKGVAIPPGTRFIEVKGKATFGEISLSANEFKTAQRLGEDYWLYVVFNCASIPEVTQIQNPARFDWEPMSKIDCYRIDAKTVLEGC